MELPPDTLLRNRYRIVRLLGKGGMGAVYLAYDTTLDHQVAVKFNQNVTEQASTQFLREARLLASLRHPYLPRVSDYFLEGPNQYLVMDFIPGEDLNTLLEKNGALPLEQVLRYAEQLGSALEYMHNQKPSIVHRDIKPGNIKLTEEGEVCLVDFGIAKAIDPTQATATGAMGYTPGFAPPEQYGHGHTGPYSDQYAFAATLYNLLCGQKPTDSVQRLLGQAVLTPITSLNATIPAHVEKALEKALSIKPDDRFENIRQFLKALLDPSFEPTIRKPVESVVSPTVVQPRPKRPAWIIPVAGIAVVAVLAVGAVLVLGGNQPAPTATPTTRVIAQVSNTPRATETEKTTLTATETLQPSPTLEPTLTFTPTETITPEPSPTPTLAPLGGGGMIAFASNRADGKTFQIYTMRVVLDNSGNFVTSDLTQITTDKGNKSNPAWSPDGTKLLYVGPGGLAPNGLDLGLDIFMLDLEHPTEPPINLTERYGNDSDPTWSSDGKWIAYDSDNARTNNVKTLYLVDPNVPGARTQIGGDQQEFHPTWSPDGERLAFVMLANTNNILVWRSKTDNYATREYFDLAQMAGRTGQVSDPVFSPDGSQIAYTRMDGGLRRIYSVFTDSRGSDIHPLSKASRDRDPAWSPDGQWIVFTSERDNNMEIYLMTSSGLLETNLTLDPGKDQQPAWQPLP